MIGLLKRLFSKQPRWNGTPETFLAMVIEMQAMNNPEYSRQEVLQLGEIMQKVVYVDLSPYKNFSDLMGRATPDFSEVKLMRKKMQEHRERVDLKKAIYGEKTDLGDDDIMRSDSDGARFARKFVNGLGKYVDFRRDEEDEGTQDKLT
jgi:hypothetical protein